jgi:hypothetical protein
MREGLRPVLAPLDEEVDHARGTTAGRVILLLAASVSTDRSMFTPEDMRNTLAHGAKP